MTQSSLHRHKSGQRRWLALDVFRGLAVLSMIQGHTFTALLPQSAYQGAWVQWHTIVHGHTAPMFLFGAGLAYGIVTWASRNISAQPERPARDPWRLVRRAFTLIFLGFLLQIPKAPWSEIFARRDMQAVALHVGPLQLVGACLLCAEAMKALFGKGRSFLWAMTSFGLAVTAVAPLTWMMRLSQGEHLALGMWLDGYGGSLFPFFPWAAFFFFGVLLSAVVPAQLKSGSQLRYAAFGAGLLALGAALALVPYWFFLHGWVMRSIYGNYELWHTSPMFVSFRVGIVVGWLGVLCLLEPLVAALWKLSPNLERQFGMLSRQSLVAYVVHLSVIYGTPYTVGLVRLGQTLTIPQAILTVMLLLAFTQLTVVLWDRYVTSGLLRKHVSAALSGSWQALRERAF